MKFCTLSSGSKGNCEFIGTDRTKLLIDAGLSGAKIEQLLHRIGENPSKLQGILVTHEHRDHIHGVGVLARRYGLKVFANERTWRAMLPYIKGVPGENMVVIENHRSFTLGDLFVYPINTFHDCAHGTAYIIGQGDKKISVLTDTGWVNREMKEKIQGSDLYHIEANHDEDMLLYGPYPLHLKQRIASNRGHMSNMACATVLGEVLERKKEKVILAHLSDQNNTPRLAGRTVREFLQTKNLIEGVDFTMDIAREESPGKIYTI